MLIRSLIFSLIWCFSSFSNYNFMDKSIFLKIISSFFKYFQFLKQLFHLFFAIIHYRPELAPLLIKKYSSRLKYKSPESWHLELLKSRSRFEPCLWNSRIRSTILILRAAATSMMTTR